MTSSDAVATASGWARRFLLRPSTFARLVTATRSEVLELTRVRWRGRRREVVARTAPTDSRSRKLAEPLDPRSFDPWADDAATLPARTRQLVECPACEGAKKLTCPDCRGTAVVACATCGGRGTAYSSRSARIINCRSCRGQGRRRCACRDGLVRCPACAGRGKVDRWLEVAEERFARVTHTPLDLLASSLPDPTEPNSFDLPASATRLKPEESWTGSPATPLPPQHAGLLTGASPLALRLDPTRDRLDDLAIQVFRGIASTVTYQLLGATGAVRVQHWNGTLSETPTSRRPFRRRLALLAATAGLGLLAGLAVAVHYAGQHPYLAANANSSLLILLAFALAGAALWPASQLALPRRARRPGRLLVSPPPAPRRRRRPGRRRQLRLPDPRPRPPARRRRRRRRRPPRSGRHRRPRPRPRRPRLPRPAPPRARPRPLRSSHRLGSHPRRLLRRGAPQGRRSARSPAHRRPRRRAAGGATGRGQRAPPRARTRNARGRPAPPAAPLGDAPRARRPLRRPPRQHLRPERAPPRPRRRLHRRRAGGGLRPRRRRRLATAARRLEHDPLAAGPHRPPRRLPGDPKPARLPRRGRGAARSPPGRP